MKLRIKHLSQHVHYFKDTNFIYKRPKYVGPSKFIIYKLSLVQWTVTNVHNFIFQFPFMSNNLKWYIHHILLYFRTILMTTVRNHNIFYLKSVVIIVLFDTGKLCIQLPLPFNKRKVDFSLWNAIQAFQWIDRIIFDCIGYINFHYCVISNDLWKILLASSHDNLYFVRHWIINENICE